MMFIGDVLCDCCCVCGGGVLLLSLSSAMADVFPPLIHPPVSAPATHSPAHGCHSMCLVKQSLPWAISGANMMQDVHYSAPRRFCGSGPCAGRAANVGQHPVTKKRVKN